jgi:hypothetical protein
MKFEVDPFILKMRYYTLFYILYTTLWFTTRKLNEKGRSNASLQWNGISKTNARFVKVHLVVPTCSTSNHQHTSWML